MAKKVLSMLLCSCLAAGLLAGCGNAENKESEVSESASVGSETESGSEEKEEKELVTLSYYNEAALGDFKNAGWLAKLLEEEVGVTFDHKVNTGTDLMGPYLASGNMPDLVVFSGADDMITAAQGGLLLDFNDYRDKLPNVFENSVFDIGRTYMEATTGSLYALPMNVSDYAPGGNTDMLRWDVYMDAGAPELNTWDDLLDVLAKMKEVYPVNEEGYEMYGFGLFNDWDRTYQYNVWCPFMKANNWEIVNGITYANRDYTVVKSIFDEDSHYLESLRWLNKAYHMGLIDPDSKAQVFEGYNTKAANGQYLYIWWDWWTYGDSFAEDFAGYAPVWASEVDYYEGTPNYHGMGQYMAISSTCENVDAAIEFVNWFYSYDTSRLLLNGPEGILYEWKDGEKVATQLTLDLAKSGDEYEYPEGGTIADTLNVFQEAAHGVYAIDPKGGYMHRDQNNSYKESMNADKGTNYLLESWEEVYGECNSLTPSVYGAYQEKGVEMKKGSSAVTFMPPMEDELTVIETQVGEIVVQNSWKMIYAEDEAEFNALWEATKADAEALGADKVYEADVKRVEEGRKMAASYGLN